MIALEASADIMLINACTKKQVIEDECQVLLRKLKTSVMEINHQESEKIKIEEEYLNSLPF